MMMGDKGVGDKRVIDKEVVMILLGRQFKNRAVRLIV
jgi:hypothetical protein